MCEHFCQRVRESIFHVHNKVLLCCVKPSACVSLQFVDSDNLLTNPRVLNLLMAENLTLVAPMLESRSLYSNFWCGITPQVQYFKLFFSSFGAHVHTNTQTFKVVFNNSVWPSSSAAFLISLCLLFLVLIFATVQPKTPGSNISAHSSQCNFFFFLKFNSGNDHLLTKNIM